MSKSQPPPQQQPLPQSIILGCNAFNCASKISNANWETKLSTQVNVNQGDSIGVKASFIDTRGTASGNIILTKDTEISLEYYFYYIHCFNACDPSGITTSSADLSSNLTQQVLVGQSIPFLYDYASTDLSGVKIPAYITQADPSGNFAATPINDSDGLPYMVYQSSNVIPVAPVYGTTIPASQIVTGIQYRVITSGLTTNWEYAGVTDVSENVLPVGFISNSQYFTAAANPNGVEVPALSPLDTNPGMPPSAFLLPANVNPTLPYVSYMITTVGDTQWDVIDPSSVGVITTSSPSNMTAGNYYGIETLGNLNWVALGAASSTVNEEFLYTPPPPVPLDFPITLSNTFFHTNAQYFFKDTGADFGASPDDFFECVIGITNDASFNYTLNSFSGSGEWCINIGALAEWNIPSITFGADPAVCPSATNLLISNFTLAAPTPIVVNLLVPGTKYLVDTTGVNDGSDPPFTWNMVSDLPTTDTSLMVAGNQYQVYEYTGTVIPYAPFQGVLTDVFISQGPIASPGPYYPFLLYSTSSNPPTPNIFVTVSLIFDGIGYTFTNSAVISLKVTRDANGNCIILPNSSIITDVAGFVDDVDVALTVINGPAQAGFPAINVTFSSSLANGDFSPDLSSIINFSQDSFIGIVPFPGSTFGPSLLVQLQGNVGPSSYTYDANSPNIGDCAVYYTNGDPPVTDIDIAPAVLTMDASGQWLFNPYPTSNVGSNFGNFQFTPLILNLTGPPQLGDPSFNLNFISSDLTEGGYVINTAVFDPTTSTPQLFPVLLGPIPFTCSIPYPNAATTSTAIPFAGTLNSATISGVGYLQGTVFSAAGIGTIINSINPDPASPSTGRAVLYPTPYDISGVIYDGTVQQVVSPPTFKTDIRPVKKIWKMKLKAGSYDPNNLAEIITRNMSRQKVKRVNNVTGAPFGTQSTLTVPTDSIYNTQTAAWANPAGGGQNTFFDSKNPKVYGYPSELDYNIDPDNDDLPFIFVPAMNSSYLRENPTPSPPDYIYAQIPHPNSNGLNNIPNTKYFINLVPLLSDVRSVSPTIPQDISGGYYTILPFYSQNTVASGSTTGHGGIFPVAFGATQTSLLFNNEGNGLFSFNYLHSPILAFLSSASNDLTECTAHMFTTQQTSSNMKQSSFFTTLIDKKSGILLKDMQPRSFWSQLGFDVDAITVNLDDKPPGFQMTLNEFESKTTGGFCGSSNIFNSQFHTKGSADQPNVPDTELLFLTADVATDEGSAIIPFTVSSPNTTVGDLYLINNLGTFGYSDGDEDQYATASDWSQYFTAVNPGESAASAYSGMLVQSNGNWDGDSYSTPGFDVPLYWAWPGAVTLPQEYDPPSVFIPTSNKTTTTQLQNNYFQVENTNTLNAVRIPTVRDQTGHFLIEITGYNSIYLDDKSKREIKSIVSSYFVTENFTCQVFPESYNYYHVGAPISLSNLKIRILDPYTMEEAQIGSNSSVYLQVNKMLSDIAVQQVEN